jgi:crotonobetainyl-CoA:carnitine CoA-transferase CaiB-like acyl-CoA transferase
VLNELIDQIVATTSCAEWLERLSTVGVPCAPLQTVKEVFAHPQSVALEMLQSLPDADMTLMSLPLRFDGERPPFRSRPPELGQDTADVLSPTVRS